MLGLIMPRTSALHKKKKEPLVKARTSRQKDKKQLEADVAPLTATPSEALTCGSPRSNVAKRKRLLTRSSEEQSKPLPEEGHREMKVSLSLPPEQLELVKGVYTRLTTDDMMKRCLQGLKQNPNESFHSHIQLHCPKHLRATKRKLDFAASVVMMECNRGYVASNLHRCLSLPYTSILDKDLKRRYNRMDRPLMKMMRNKRLQRDLLYSPGNFLWVGARRCGETHLCTPFSTK